MRNSRLSNVKFFLYATLIWLVAVAVFQWHTSRARQAWSATVDETCYLTCATNTAHLGRLDPQLVSFGIAPLPILVQWLPSALSQEHSLRYTYWQGTLNDPALVNAARWLTSWLVGSGLLACVFWWVCLRRGLFWGAVAVLLVAGSPHIIAHCSLATTDALATWMWIGCLAVYTWSLRRLSRAATRTGKVGADLEIGNALAGLACGTAISAKYSGVVLLLVWGAVWTVFSLRPLFSRAAAMKLVSGQALAAGNPAQNRRLAPGRSLGCWFTANRLKVLGDWCLGLFIFALVAFVTCWAWHGSEMATQRGTLADRSVSGSGMVANTSLPAPITAILEQQAHNQRGHAAMLFGRVSMHGWWYYFPALAVLKSTPAELVLLLLTIPALLASWRKLRRLPDDEGGTGPGFATAVWVTALLLGCLMLLLVRVQIGYRYALPLLIIAMLLSIDWLADVTERRSTSKRIRRTIQCLVCLLCATQLWGSSANAPHYLSYLSPLFGGGGEAYRYVADSNVDWGQDLPALKRVTEELSIEPSRLALSYFGTAEPRAYGVEAVVVSDLSSVELDRFDYLAVSVNHLYGISPTAAPVSKDFERLRSCPVAARAGNSILIFSVAEMRLWLAGVR